MTTPDRSARKMVEICEDPWETLRRCGGYYHTPCDKGGKRLGPLVGYAGTYAAADGSKKHFVGDTYVNFAQAERFHHVVDRFAQQLWAKLTDRKLWESLANYPPQIDVFCGAPIGGYSLADALGRVSDRLAIKAEKKVTIAASGGQREESRIIFGRHDINPGDRVAIVEDVCNNFSTTDELIQEIHRLGGQVVVITCFLNRSLTTGEIYRSESADGFYPVAPLLRERIRQFQQDDEEVAADIAAGNVVWKPKFEWPRLMAAMEAHPTGK